MGDDTFKSQVLIRPKMLLHILKQGYTLLWTDSDMVWLGNPLPLLPAMNHPEAVSVTTYWDQASAVRELHVLGSEYMLLSAQPAICDLSFMRIGSIKGSKKP